MTNENFGPLAGLIGKWTGDRGTDVAPEPDGSETSAYRENIVFEPVGDVSNAEKQTLWAVRYRLIVVRKSDEKEYHNQTGYWMWDVDTDEVIHSLAIPRAVSVIAGGTYTSADDGITMEVAARLGDADWGIVQSPFMRDNASTREFRQTLRLAGDTLSYTQTTVVDIYGKAFDHTDENTLTRVSTT